jgi:hypothetical protein
MHLLQKKHHIRGNVLKFLSSPCAVHDEDSTSALPISGIDASAIAWGVRNPAF